MPTKRISQKSDRSSFWHLEKVLLCAVNLSTMQSGTIRAARNLYALFYICGSGQQCRIVSRVCRRYFPDKNVSSSYYTGEHAITIGLFDREKCTRCGICCWATILVYLIKLSYFNGVCPPCHSLYSYMKSYAIFGAHFQPFASIVYSY